MKILHVIPGIAPRYGGPSLAINGMSRALIEAGVEVLVATTDADGAGQLAVPLAEITDYQGVPTIFFRRQWSEAFKYSQPLAQWLQKHAGEFDVIHIHAVFSHACLAAGRAARKWRVPYIVRPLGTLAPWSLEQKSRRKQLFWHLGVKKFLQQAAAIHYTAQQEQELTEKSLGLQNGVVIPLGVELKFEETEAEDVFRIRFPTLGRQAYILVLARLHPKKGQDLLLEAFLSLTRQTEFAAWRLVLAGDGEAVHKARLEKIVQDSGQTDKVIFTGWIGGAQKNAALKYASLLALTSHQENFGLCVVEALALGVPVLVSPHVDIAPDIAAADVGWVSPLDADALRQNLATALRDKAARETKGAAGRIFVERYQWPGIAGSLKSLYGDVIRECAL